MGVKNCPECGKLFLENPENLCQACYAEVRQDEVKVGEYLRDVGTSSIFEIHEATGVKEKIILRMIKQGRIVDGISITYPCSSCGFPISEGSMCRKCSSGILEQIKTMSDQKAADDEARRKGERMYSRDKEIPKK